MIKKMRKIKEVTKTRKVGLLLVLLGGNEVCN